MPAKRADTSQPDTLTACGVEPEPRFSYPGFEGFTAREVAAMLRVSPEYVLRMAKTDQWPSWKQGRVIRFFPEDLKAIKQLGRQPVVPVGLTRHPRRRRAAG